jgi:ATP-dependent DNA helicase RecG
MITKELQFILSQGEGQHVEFKEKLDKTLSKELVAFANASGGKIFLGVSDKAEVKGIHVDNKLKSQIQDIARNCDPSIIINLIEENNILIIEINEGLNKPYSCSDGFYLRVGANSQKLKRDEIIQFSITEGKIRFDEQICNEFDYTADLDSNKLNKYLDCVD